MANKKFSHIVAPFDGVVTGRTADIGGLVGTSASGNPLFTVSDTHALRLYVNVPQSYTAQIVPGMTVSLSVPEYPGKTFPAHLVSSSGAINSQTSTMLVQFEADNRDGLLKPGGYAQVNLGVPNSGSMLRLPASALMFRAQRGCRWRPWGRRTEDPDEIHHGGHGPGDHGGGVLRPRPE
ncbi:MAG: efflux RND transporter periplasmic adaptor subunit [Alphaproteobacteria bacterium]